MRKTENLLIFLNTKDRDSTTTSASITNFSFPLSHLISDRVAEAAFHLFNAEIPNVMYPISAARQNNKLYFQEDGSTAATFTATLSDNNYTGSQFATALQTAMNAAGAAHTYTVSYDSQSYKITIVTNGTSVKLVTGTNSMENEIGADVTQAFAATYVCAYPVNLSPTKYIDIGIGSFSNQNASSSNTLKPLYRIPMDVPFGAIVYHHASQEENIRITVHSWQDMQIIFLDDKGIPISIPNNHNISLTLKLSYDYRH